MSSQRSGHANGSSRGQSPRPVPDDEPVLPDVTADERDQGWGDDPESGRRDDDWYRRERPPHHE